MFHCLIILASLFNFSISVVIDNTLPRRDVEGKLMDIHDGNVIQIGDLFYWL